MKTPRKMSKKFWAIIQHNWTVQERAQLRAIFEAWEAAGNKP